MSIRTKLCLAALAAATTLTAPVAAQTQAQQQRWENAQRRFEQERDLYERERQLYEGTRGGRGSGWNSDYRGSDRGNDSWRSDDDRYRGDDRRDDRYERDDRYGRDDRYNDDDDRGFDESRFRTEYDASRYYRSGSRYRERALTAKDEVYRGSDGRYYCKRTDGTTGLIVGGAGGAILGNVIDGGRNRAAGTLIGGALGALLGREVERSNQVRCR